MVRERLQGLIVSPQQREQIITELAGHLEDVWQQQLAEGETESEALQRTLERVTDWPQLARRIQRAKREEEMMNYRTRTFWLPGLVSLTAAMGWLMILEMTALWIHEMAFPVYVPWLLFLPFCGAAGAYLSRRCGGQRLTSLAAGLFPSIVVLALFCLILPLAIFHERNAFVIHHPLHFAFGALSCTAVCGLALLLGVIPFLKTQQVRQS